MTHGLTDIVETVTVPKSEYEELVRDSERFETIKRYLSTNEYIDRKVLISILNIEESEDE